MAGVDPGRVPNIKPVSQNGFTLDMFGRLKVGEGFSLFDSQHRYFDNGHYDDEIIGGGASTHLPNESTVSLSVGTASGDKVTRESRRVFPYQPGKSLQVMQTFVLNEPKPNLRQRVGYFSRHNGVFLEVTDEDVFLVIRGYTTGQLQEVKVRQAEWNVDNLLGDSATDQLLDLGKAQIMFTEIEWLGAGSVRVGFIINGVPIVAHRFDHANLIEGVYMTTAVLPVRYEIENLAATSSSSRMKQICVSVISNGGFFKALEVYNATRQETQVGEVYYPLVSIRLASGREDSVIIPSDVSIFPTTANDFDYALIRNPSSITGGTWVAHPHNPNVEYNIGATAMTGGTPMQEGFFGAENQSASPVSGGDVRNFSYQLGRTNSDTPVSDVVTLAVKVVGANNGNVKSSLGWYDLL